MRRLEAAFMDKTTSNKVDRRKFLASAVVAGAAAVTTGGGTKAALGPSGSQTPPRPSALRPSARMAQAETGTLTDAVPPAHPGTLPGKPGSD